MNRKNYFLWSCAIIGLIALCMYIVSCGGVVNTNFDSHFTEDGELVADSDSVRDFAPCRPNLIKFYVEVSGSMNGFFRSGVPTDFKTDVWQVMSYYSPASPGVTILTNDGSVGQRLSFDTFRSQMNTGAFVSSASTRVPVMLESVFSDLDAEAGEVGVLVSDMKYSPVGQKAPEVLLGQYTTDIGEIFGKHGLAVSLILATSSYADRKGGIVPDVASPYYFLVIGKPEHVAELRNGISSFLEDANHFVDNIESGFDYGQIKYSFGIPKNCWQLDDVNPTFCGYDPSVDDTCTVRLKLSLENYRWRIADADILRDYFTAECKYGSQVEIGDISIDVKKKTETHVLHRTATATIDLKLFDMATDSEVIEWTLNLPDTEYTLFGPFVEGAVDESDITKSYSVDRFIKGMFYGGVVNKPLNKNYILISKNS